MVFLELWREARGSSRFMLGIREPLKLKKCLLNLLSCCLGEFRIDIELLQGNLTDLDLWWDSQVSPRVVTGIKGNLSSCKKGVKPRFKLQGGTQDCYRVAEGESGLISG